MGAIHFRRIELVTSLNELVGYKAGMALTRDQMQEHLGGDESGVISGNDEAMLRIRSEEFDELLCRICKPLSPAFSWANENCAYGVILGC